MFGERFKEIRRDHALNQVDMANLLRITQAHLSRLESGKSIPSKMLVQLICHEFDVNEEWLIDGKGCKYVNEHIIRAAGYYDAWRSASGYVIKYIHVAEMLAKACNLDQVFFDLFNNTDSQRVLNYIVSKLLNVDDHDARLEFLHRLENTFPDFRDYCMNFWNTDKERERHLDELSNLPIWKDAAVFNQCIDAIPPAGRSYAMTLEDNLLSHRIYSSVLAQEASDH